MRGERAQTSEAGFGLGGDFDLDKIEARAAEAERAAQPPASPLQWARQNLFSGWLNGLLTVATAAFALFALFQLAQFVLFSAQWRVVDANLRGYMVGPWPTDELWRVWIVAYLVAALAGLSAGAVRRRIHWTIEKAILAIAVAAVATVAVLLLVDTLVVRLLAGGGVATVAATLTTGRVIGPRAKRALVVAWMLAFPVVIAILVAFDGVPTRQWGGFLFNILAATVGIVASFPIGIALALGRRSSLPAVRTVCIVFIEIFRGVPLVAWLIFSKYVVAIILPPQMEVPDIVKALIVMTLFSSAYVAEIIRGGLQGVDTGQYEAARALGLSTTRMMALVVLPQALRSTIPAMIGHFISLFKDTSLFSAIEVTDLLAAARRSATSLQFFGRDMETLLFAGLLFWLVAFSMSRWSQRLELRLGVGER